MLQVDLLIFDLDGTLIRSGDDLAASVNHMLKALGLPTLAPETVYGFVGDGVEMLIKRALGTAAADNFDRATGLFAAHYSEHMLDQTRLYEDVLPVLDFFGRKTKVIVTNKRRDFALRIIRELGIHSRIAEIFGEESAPFKKPDPRLLQWVMSRWGQTPERTIVIGDGVNDLLLARRAGAWSCAFLNGITARDKLLALSPDLTCESLSDLKTLIC
jgi:phosphoglycolate phosphatase